MKTAVSLPDALFRAADRHALRAGKSRSKLYAEAITEYLSRHSPDDVTEAMNRVVDELPRERDRFVEAAARSVLRRIEW
jgi:metal-responsive CopG/Arc/MetJ family transcriptional regulator